ncbi:diheme cytochrome c [Polaromonas sp. YR568]|uniref:diheme cytochrome c n=1 Tax=Polaromonas sp. YR568 TaxID=1855301 RepID=UPI0031379E27
MWLTLAASAFMAAGGVWAEARTPAGPILPKYQAECAACHTAYPAGMLPATSWKRIMGSLDKHYGTDASLDAASVKEISQWLQTHAGTYKRVRDEPPQDRITTSAWFVRKHDELNSATWKHAAVKSAANCMACHTRADKGSFSEREIVLPKGVGTNERDK